MMVSISSAGSGFIGVNSCGKTDKGLKRNSNQDSIYLDNDKQFYILADGMGGHVGGEEASRLATEFASNVLENPDGDYQVDLDDLQFMEGLSGAARLTRLAIQEADKAIVTASVENSRLDGMGSTIETLYLDNDIATIGHVGDSRVYRMRKDRLHMVTEDHSFLNEELKHRSMSSEEIANYPFKNRITRALGHLSDRRIDVFQGKVIKGDMFLMCSDGLTDVTKDSVIREILLENHDNPQLACDTLITIANDHGGPDNISVITVVII